MTYRRYRAGKLERALMKAARAADWLGEEDYATLQVARRLCAQLDRLEAAREAKVEQLTLDDDGTEPVVGDPSKVAYLAGQLLQYLKALHLTPEARGAAPGETDDPLADLRDRVARNRLNA